jgi:hypothetical protein
LGQIPPRTQEPQRVTSASIVRRCVAEHWGRVKGARRETTGSCGEADVVRISVANKTVVGNPCQQFIVEHAPVVAKEWNAARVGYWIFSSMPTLSVGGMSADLAVQSCASGFASHDRIDTAGGAGLCFSMVDANQLQTHPSKPSEVVAFPGSEMARQ